MLKRPYFSPLKLLWLSHIVYYGREFSFWYLTKLQSYFKVPGYWQTDRQTDGGNSWSDYINTSSGGEECAHRGVSLCLHSHWAVSVVCGVLSVQYIYISVCPSVCAVSWLRDGDWRHQVYGGGRVADWRCEYMTSSCLHLVALSAVSLSATGGFCLCIDSWQSIWERSGNRRCFLKRYRCSHHLGLNSPII